MHLYSLYLVHWSFTVCLFSMGAPLRRKVFKFLELSCHLKPLSFVLQPEALNHQWGYILGIAVFKYVVHAFHQGCLLCSCNASHASSSLFASFLWQVGMLYVHIFFFTVDPSKNDYHRHHHHHHHSPLATSIIIAFLKTFIPCSILLHIFVYLFTSNKVQCFVSTYFLIANRLSNKPRNT